MARFFALTSRGLVDALNDELNALGFTKTSKFPGGVFFESNWEGCYRANLCLRTATRVVLPVLDFPAYKQEELYNNVLKHDFTKYITPDDTLAVDATVQDCAIHDQRLVAMKIKDAVVDQFREKFGRRPDVNSIAPTMRLIVRAVKNEFSISVDTSGDPLFKRGYRLDQGPAPLKEHLAAALVDISGWDGTVPLVDPMCGSGTFLIEAALKSLKIAPGTLRTHFAFQKYLNFQKDKWEEVVQEVMDQELETTPVKFYGFDIDKKSVSASVRNVGAAGLSDFIEIKRSGVDMIEAPAEKGMIIVNPPYGERIGHPGEMEDLYKDLAYILKSKFKGWTVWILAGNAELTAHLKMKSTRKVRVFNGPIECRFLKYEIF